MFQLLWVVVPWLVFPCGVMGGRSPRQRHRHRWECDRHSGPDGLMETFTLADDCKITHGGKSATLKDIDNGTSPV